MQKLEPLLNQQSFLLIRCFGHFIVETSHKIPLEWQRQGVKKLFALLLIYPDGVSVDKLKESLFSNKKKNQEYNLKTLIYYLRRLLEPHIEKFEESNFILYENGKYKFNFESKYYLLDLKEFILHYQRGLNAIKEKNINSGYMEYKKAAELYTGDMLEDIDLIELEGIRESYRKYYLQILLFLAEYSLNNNIYENCICYSEQILTYDKYEERAYCYLMRSYFRTGQKNLVKNKYYLCKKVIEKELKIKLSRQTEELYKQLMKI